MKPYVKPTVLLLSFLFQCLWVNADTCRIVQWGADWGTGFYRGIWAKLLEPAIDVDGDGSVEDDSVSGWPFSMTIPLNPPGVIYDTDALSAIFYGGLTLYTANNPKRRMTEGHINQNHEFRDDFNIMTLPKAQSKDEILSAYALFFWKKEDFLNGGEHHQVSFNEESCISVHISRYWGGVNSGRWVARDGEQFYVSEKTFGGVTQQVFLIEGQTMDAGNNPLTRCTHTLVPTESRWAPYNPEEPYHLEFDASKADFKPHNFSNITAAGFIVIRDPSPAAAIARGLSLGEPIGVKFNSFACIANIDNKGKSANVQMVPSGIKDVQISSDPISFTTWDRLRRGGISNQSCDLNGFGGYMPERGDGAMGTMLADDTPHAGSEPVTCITWLDAIAFCNILSEFEGREPAYYEDAAFTRVLRVFRDRNMKEKDDLRPPVFWKNESTGFRLPTLAEYKVATSSKTIKPGFISSYVWDDGSAEQCRIAYTGQRETPIEKTRVPFSDEPAQGAYDISFHIARNYPGTPAISSTLPLSPVASTLFYKGEKRKSVASLTATDLRRMVKKNLPEVRINTGLAEPENKVSVSSTEKNDNPDLTTYPVLISATEIPYKLWKLIACWSTAEKGYSYNYTGDMGSMRVKTENSKHEQSEPVTYISWHDAVVWCNAISELNGLRPVYYNDKEFIDVYRNALPFRVDTYIYPGYPRYPFANRDTRPPHTGSWISVFMDVKADGYRLPLFTEFEHCNIKVKKTEATEYEWLNSNSAMQTHGVGTRRPYSSGLYDMQGNILEWAWGDPGKSFGIKRYGGVFSHPYGGVHPSLDVKEFASVARPYVGLRILRRP